MDFNADAQLRKVINELLDENYKPTIPDWKMWKHYTDRMLRWMPVAEIVDNVLAIAEGISDEQWEEGYPKVLQEELEEVKIKVKSKSKSKDVIEINEKISILEEAKKFGLKIKNNSCVCPFHPDTDPSLMFYPPTNSFFCFGCRKGGDIVEFYRKMREVKILGQERSDK
jgi:hypothetical protein